MKMVILSSVREGVAEVQLGELAVSVGEGEDKAEVMWVFQLQVLMIMMVMGGSI